MNNFVAETEQKITEGYRLSPQQRHLWFLQKTETTTKYVAKCAISISGKVDLQPLESALHKIVDRHEIFRTNFDSLPGMTVGVQIIRDVNISWEKEHDLTMVDSSEKMAEFENIWENFSQRNFDLKQGSLFHASLVKISPKWQILLISLPSLNADSKTLQILVRELSQEYNACLEGNKLPEAELQYADIAEWQNELLEAEDAKLGKEYWQKQDFSPRFNLELPFAKKSEAFQPQIEKITIDRNLADNIEGRAKQLDVSTSDFLLTCWLTLIWRLTGESNIVVGVMGDGRRYEELETALGLFAKHLPFCCQVGEELKFYQFLERVKLSVSEVFKWQDYFTWEQFIAPTENYSQECFLPLAFEFIEAANISGNTNFALDIIYTCIDKYHVKLVVTKNQNLTAEFHYDSNTYQTEDIQRLVAQFQTLLTSALENPAAEISKLKINNNQHLQQLLVEFNNTQKTYPENQCIHQIFEQQSQLTPDNIAVVFEDRQISYAQLNAKSNQLAHYLQRQGIKPEVAVGIYSDRSLETIIAILAILKAGGAYLPLDPKLPPENLSFRLQDANAPAVLTKQHLVKNLPNSGIEKICLDSDWDQICQESTDNPSSEVTPENLIYLIYTSGSTGKPKGVAIEHQQLLNYIRSITNVLPCIIATYAIVSTFAADLGNTVVFPALCSGGCLHIISEECAFDAEALTEYFSANPIDCLKIVPSHLGALLSSSHPEKILPRQRLILGGEALSWQLLERIQKLAPDCQIFNHYGPSETTVGATTLKLDSMEYSSYSKTVPLGRPIANTHIYILDRHQQPVPLGVAGELHIGGAGLARGYLNRPELTAEKFIFREGNREQGTGNRLYKTGDLARYLPDGNIEYLGRIDNQVKIRGFRIELGEIEAALSSHPQVQQTVVISREDELGDRRLFAYFVSVDHTSNSKNNLEKDGNNLLKELVSELRHFLCAKLPDYMIPSFFVPLKTLPLTPNGKVDRRSLPVPDLARTGLEANFVAARTPEEKLLANIYLEVLGIPQVGIHDNFFDLGGHSLLATQLISQIRETLEIKITLKTLFESPTIVKLAKTIEEMLQTGICDQEEINFNTEVILDPTIIPQTTISHNIIDPQNILLTGVTGFVGVYLLDELLRNTSANIYCLIRANDDDSAKQKLQKKLESYWLWDETFSSRIIPVVGDLSSKFCGLSREKFNHLAEQIDVIYHSGAWVNHVYPYTVLKPTNVLGTQEVLRLASETHVKAVHFISTIGVLPSSSNSESTTIFESEPLTETPNLKGGYAQSKWVAEKLVMAAQDRGIPTCIYRLPMITGDTDTGVSNINDRICRQIKGCIQLGLVPILESQLADNWIPVNQISQAIVHLSQREESLGKVFHLLNPHPTSFNHLFDWICSLDYSVKKVSLNEWITELSSHPENVLYPYLFKLESQMKKYAEKKLEGVAKSMDTSNTKNGLANSNIIFSSIDTKYLETMLSYLNKSNFLNW